jgi:hypothetical protein
MKRLTFTGLLMAAILCLSLTAQAQNQPKMLCGVTVLETNGIGYTSQLMGNLVRMELEKTGKYNVVDKWDMLAALKKIGSPEDSCLGKTCIVKLGTALEADKMLTGDVNRFGDKIVLSLRLIDVKENAIEKAQVDEYLDLPENMQEMVRLSIARLIGLPYDADLYGKLSKQAEYAGEANFPDVDKLSLSGPRMGAVLFTGEMASRFAAPTSQGGMNDHFPVMFVFGYQQEIMYLNSGNFQALFEMIPAVTGMDKGLFIPSLSLMNGFRENIHGWEFAFGPNFYFTREESGYYDESGAWKLMGTGEPQGIEYIDRYDSRGSITLKSAFIIAAGRSFKSGRMNIPVNVYVIPNRTGMRIGLNFGYNVAKRK